MRSAPSEQCDNVSDRSQVRVLFEAPSLGDEMTPHAETLEKSRVSVIFMPKIYVTVHDTPLRTCWTRTYVMIIDLFIEKCIIKPRW